MPVNLDDGAIAGIFANQLNPVDIQTKYQNLSNLQQDQLNKQQSLLNDQQQLENLKSSNALTVQNTVNAKQDYSKTARDQSMQDLASILTLPDSEMADGAQHKIDIELQTGAIEPERYQMLKQVIDQAKQTKDTTHLRQLGMTAIMGRMSGNEQMTSLQPKYTAHQAGNRTAIMAEPSAVQNMQANVNGQTPTAPQEVTSVQNGLTPEQQTEFVNLPDVNDPSKTNYYRKPDLLPNGQPGPNAKPIQAAPDTMVEAFRGQEGTPDGRTSSKGAVGQLQVTPGFFQTYAQPGESFQSKHDVEQVARRGIAIINSKYPNDPQRAAVEYFSGPGNVAPPGSPTPWKEDRDDGHTKVSTYVSGYIDKLHRLQAQNGNKGGDQTAPNTTTQGSPGQGAGQPNTQPATTTQAPNGQTAGGSNGLPAPILTTQNPDITKKNIAESYATKDMDANYANDHNTQKMLEAVLKNPGIISGTDANAIHTLKSRLYEAGLISDDGMKNLKDSEVLGKLLEDNAARQAQILGTAGTDAGRLIASHASPHADMSQPAMQEALRFQMGNRDAIHAMAQAWQTAQANGYPEANFQKWRNDFFNKVDPQTGGKFDPRAFIIERMKMNNPAEYEDFKSKLNDQGRKQLLANHAYASKQGWLPND
jgi:hypothetical protein